jgi:hypothetical protein
MPQLTVMRCVARGRAVSGVEKSAAKADYFPLSMGEGAEDQFIKSMTGTDTLDGNRTLGNGAKQPLRHP